jgi:hypothetical protein
MNTLNIALQDGFHADSVIITVNNQIAYKKSGVTTNLTISYADAAVVPVSEDTALVDVQVTSRSQSAQITLNVKETPYLAVQLSDDGRLQLRPSDEMFRYM